MKCPVCQGETKVLDSRGTKRRRECIDCLTRFSTNELLIDESMDDFLKEQVLPIVYKPTGRGKWTKSEIDFLIASYIEKIPIVEIAKTLNRNYMGVIQKIRRLKKDGILDL